MRRILTLPFLFFIIACLSVIVFALLLLSPYNPFRKDTVMVDASRTGIAQKIAQMGRMETVSQQITTVVNPGDLDGRFKDYLKGDKAFLLVSGKVSAGVDYGPITEKDVDTLSTNLMIKLPQAVIFTTEVDPSKTKVYDKRLGLVNVASADFENRKTLFEDALKRNACDANILEQASKNAETGLTSMFAVFNFTKVMVEIPEASC